MGKAGAATENSIARDDLSELWDYAFRQRPEIDRTIEALLPSTPAGIPSTFNEAVHRAIFPGGKRIRPLVTLLGAEIFGGSVRDVLPAAAAVEFIHTSSLIFDDLPSMDDATHRRGEASLHRRYGEAMATLVAISFLNASYSMVMASPSADPERSLRAVREIVECIGPTGMIGGQVVDLSDPGPVKTAEMRRRNDLKTSSLIRLSLNLGAILSGADEESLHQLTTVAARLGDAYQKRDDLHDVAEDLQRLRDSINTNLACLPRHNGDDDLHPLEGDTSRVEFLKIGVRKDVEAARQILVAHFPPTPARDCLTQLATYIEHSSTGHR